MIRTLNLDSMFVPVPRPAIKFELFQFSGGEWHIKLNPRIEFMDISKVIITHRVRSMDDLMQVAIAKDALEREGIKNFDLIMPYIPYARQDRQCERYESFTLKVFTNHLNSLGFDNVRVLDPHSDVAPALIENCVITSNVQYVREVFFALPEAAHLIIPDAGASKKAQKLAETIPFISIVKCDKTRDTKTGELTGFKVHDIAHLGNDACIIVDDICDGGGTFIGLAEQLKKKGAGLIYLFVTHGIFSKGVESLTEHFEKVYCTNSFSTITPGDFLTQYTVQL